MIFNSNVKNFLALTAGLSASLAAYQVYQNSCKSACYQKDGRLFSSPHSSVYDPSLSTFEKAKRVATSFFKKWAYFMAFPYTLTQRLIGFVAMPNSQPLLLDINFDPYNEEKPIEEFGIERLKEKCQIANIRCFTIQVEVEGGFVPVLLIPPPDINVTIEENASLQDLQNLFQKRNFTIMGHGNGERNRDSVSINNINYLRHNYDTGLFLYDHPGVDERPSLDKLGRLTPNMLIKAHQEVLALAASFTQGRGLLLDIARSISTGIQGEALRQRPDFLKKERVVLLRLAGFSSVNAILGEHHLAGRILGSICSFFGWNLRSQVEDSYKQYIASARYDRIIGDKARLHHNCSLATDEEKKGEIITQSYDCGHNDIQLTPARYLYFFSYTPIGQDIKKETKLYSSSS